MAHGLKGHSHQGREILVAGQWSTVSTSGGQPHPPLFLFSVRPKSMVLPRQVFTARTTAVFLLSISIYKISFGIKNMSPERGKQTVPLPL